jgi:hypothetical protein
MPRANASSAAADTIRTLPTVGLSATSSPRISSGVTPTDFQGKTDLEHVGGGGGVGGDEGCDVRQRIGLGVEPGGFKIVEAGLEETLQRAGVVVGHTEQCVRGSSRNGHVIPPLVVLCPGLGPHGPGRNDRDAATNPTGCAAGLHGRHQHFYCSVPDAQPPDPTVGGSPWP